MSTSLLVALYCRDGFQLLPKAMYTVPKLTRLQASYHTVDAAIRRNGNKQEGNPEILESLHRNHYDCSKAWKWATHEDHHGDKAVRRTVNAYP